MEKDYYRKQVNEMGKKEFTLMKMQEYGFWPENLPTPYERQESETDEDYKKRSKLIDDLNKLSEEIAKLYKEKNTINHKLMEIRTKYNDTFNYEKLRAVISKQIMQESIARRKERKEKKELEKKLRSEKWAETKKENIVFIGKGYSSLLNDKKTDIQKLSEKNLPIIETDKELAEFLSIDYNTLRFLTYHRDVVTVDHYYRFTIPKRNGGVRNIAAPKKSLKLVQRKILDDILSKITVSSSAYGFLPGKSVITGAKAHTTKPNILINMDLENFFPTITFERIRGLFKYFGYSGYISSLFAMLCTYCERVPIEIKGETKYVKTTDRILPQGSPASPMITNIICAKMDKRIEGLADSFNLTYTRYADDISFTYTGKEDFLNISAFIGIINKIVKEEGFIINKKKTKILRKNNRQIITGIVINNDEIGVTKKWVKNLRALIYNTRKDIYKADSQVLNEISGRIEWLKSVNAVRYKNIINDGKNLLEMLKN